MRERFTVTLSIEVLANSHADALAKIEARLEVGRGDVERITTTAVKPNDRH